MSRLVVLAALAVAAVLASPAGAVTAPPQTFTDATGDSGTAADISSVSVTNDDHGVYTFTIAFATPYTSSDVLALLINSDLNASTGDPQDFGADYLFGDDYGSHSFFFENWSNNAWQDVQSTSASVVVAADNKSVTMKVSKADLGGSTSFSFFVLTTDGTTLSAGHFDGAPSGTGGYPYKLQEIFTLSTGSFRNGPAKAGGTWTVSLSAVRSDTGKVVTSGASIACAGKEGAKRLVLESSSFTSAGAVCTFRVPKKPKRAAVRATVTISANGRSVSKTFAATTH